MEKSVPPETSLSKTAILRIALTFLFGLYIITLPRYIEIAKYGFVLLILVAFVYLAFNSRQTRQTSGAERAFFAVVILEFLWIAFTYYFNGEPGQGDSFLWSRHFYMLFLIPMFFLFRRLEISDQVIIALLTCSVAISFLDITIDIARGVNSSIKGINRNGLGPIQLCLSGILLFYFVGRPGQPWRWLALAGFCLGVATVVFSQSRTTWTSMVLVGCLFAFYFARQLPAWQRLTLIIGVMSILYGAASLPIVSTRINYAISDITAYTSDDRGDDFRPGSLGTRIELWKTGWYIFLEHPVTGAGVGGFQVMAAENWERYQVYPGILQHKYVHNQYLAALATRGVPGLILFLLFMTIPIYIAMQHKSEDAGAEVARSSLIFICLVYLVGCLGEDHFETQPGIMFMSVFLALLLARISAGNRVIDNHLQTMAAPQG